MSDSLELRDSFSLMLCPPQDNLQVGTVLDEQKSFMVSVAGAGMRVGGGGEARGGTGAHQHFTNLVICTHSFCAYQYIRTYIYT